MTKRIAPWLVFGVFVVYLGVAGLAMPERSAAGVDLRDFRRLPVSVSGRVQPIDTLARVALLRISGGTSVDPGRSATGSPSTSLSADEWLLELLAKPDAADQRAIFPVDRELARHLSLASGAQATTWRTFRELAGKVEEIGRQTQRIAKIEAATRVGWESELLRLHDKLVVYERLKNSLQPNSALQRDAKGQPVAFDFALALGRYRGDLAEAVRTASERKEGKGVSLDRATEGRLRAFAAVFQPVARIGLVATIPPHAGQARRQWSNAGVEIENGSRGRALSPALTSWARMASAYARGDAGAFQAAAGAYRAWLGSTGLWQEVNRAGMEVLYNGLQPMLRAVPIYGLGLVLLFAAPRTRPTYQAALLLLLLGFALHTAGILFAFTLAGRPSFLVFAGWATALCGLVIECFSRRGLGLAAAGITAVAALAVTYLLAPGGAVSLLQDVRDARLLAAVVVAGLALIVAARRPEERGAGSRPADEPLRPALAEAARR